MKKFDKNLFKRSHFATLFLLLICGWYFPLQSQTIVEYTPENFHTFMSDLNAAQPNTEFVFTQEGEYVTTSFPNIDVPIVMRAAEGLTEKPVITNISSNEFTHILRIRSGGSLTAIGLEFNGKNPFKERTTWAIRTDNTVTGHYYLVVEDCVFDNFDQQAFRAAGATFADSVIFRNSVFKNIGREVIWFWQTATQRRIDLLEITHCTFNNIERGVVTYPDEAITNGVASVDHITAHNVGNEGDGWPLLGLPNFEAISFKNSIVSNATKSPLLNLGDNAVVAYNNFYQITDATLAELENTFFLNPGFADAANGDFTVNNAFLYDKSETGGVPGDPRWALDEMPNSFYYAADEALDLQAHFLVANDGDVFILTDGGQKYVFDGFPDVHAKITIMAAPDLENRPILTNGVAADWRHILRINEGGSLILKNIEFDAYAEEGGQQIFFGIRVLTGITNNYHIIAENCYFHNFSNFVRVDGATHADSIVFNHCVFETSAGEGIRFSNQPLDSPRPTFDLLKVTNSTFANIPSNAIFVQWNAEYTNGPIIIDQVTMDNTGADNKSIFRFTGARSISITNSIFSNSVSTKAFDLSGATNFDYCNLFNLVDGTSYGDFNMLALDPMYQDAANLDFTVLNSELWTAGNQGQLIGDLRWDTFRAIATPQSATSDAGQRVLAQSSRAPGHLFMVLQGEAQATIEDFNAAVQENKGATAEVTEPYVVVSLSTEGLETGIYNLYAINAEGIISAPLEGIFSIAEFKLKAFATPRTVTNAQGKFVVAQSNKASGHLFIILQGEAQTTPAEINAAVSAGKGATAAVTGANTNTNISTEGIQAGLYNLYAVDAEDNISEPLEGIFTITRVPVVVIVHAQTATNAEGQTVKVQSNYAEGKVYILKLGEAFGTVAELDAAVAADKGASAEVTAAYTNMLIDVEGLEGGIYFAFALDGDGFISLPGNNAIKIQDVTSIKSLGDDVMSKIYSSNRSVFITWDINSGENAIVDFYNILGTKVHSSILREGQNTFEFNESGILILRIHAKGYEFTKKVMVR